MRKLWKSGVVFLAVLLALVAACAPKAVPAPAPAAPAVPVAPAAKPVDAAWEQVIKAAQQEGRLVMYDATFFVGDRRIAIPKAFKERYGIPMEILVTGGSSATIEKLQVEQKMGVSVADVFIAGSLSGPRMISPLGLTREIASGLPIVQDKSVFVMEPVYSPGGEAITFAFSLIGVVANSKLVQPGEIQSYKDLMKPKYKGKIVMRDPRLGSGGSPLTLGTFRYLKILDDDFLRTLVKEQEVAMWGGGEAEVGQMLARGEYMVDMAAGIDILYANLAKEGAPVRPVYMQEGTVGMPSLILVSKNAPHPNGARLFINWLLTPEGQTVYHKAGASSPLRKDVPDFLPAVLRDEPIKKLMPTNWEISQALVKMVGDKEFDKVFGKR